ncbi:unnamed protein product [Rotaria magnacalcarata]|uniref:MULE transposase domain-containing protein n=1 Tax=Rotaria magnacalcarata TaxID=392030 RepID=A0A819XFK3_9BILA|nr:unnamed protein product [Rotaria magnacalcarata]CAF4135203.1 unnamed protein product [Rotaria magnacalcarata]
MDTFLSDPTADCHAPNPDLIASIQLKNNIKVRAATTEEQSSSILHSALRNYPILAVGALPKTETLMVTIRRQCINDKTDADGRLPDRLRKTDRGEDFILFEDEKLIIFSSKINLSLLKENKHWFADGTFKVCPDDFYQLFTLHAMMTDTIIPLVYGLLIGKSNNDYNLFFEKIFEQDDFQPESIMTDFETGTIKSVKEKLPIYNVVHKGCLFHFSQAIWRQVQNKNLATKYKEDDDIVMAFDLVAGQFDDDADDFLDYFEKTWIGEPRRRGTGRKKPLFDHKLWNIYDRIIADIPRSNNSVEGWHNSFASRVPINHPNIIKLAEKIRREQSKFEIDIAKILQGH